MSAKTPSASRTKTKSGTKTPTKSRTKTLSKKRSKTASRRMTQKVRDDKTCIRQFSKTVNLPFPLVKALLTIGVGVMHKNINMPKMKALNKATTKQDNKRFFNELAVTFLKNSNPKMRKQALFLNNALNKIHSSIGGDGVVDVRQIKDFKISNYMFLGMMIYFGLQLFVLIYSTNSVVSIISDPNMPLHHVRDITASLYTEGSSAYDIHKICAKPDSSTNSFGILNKIVPEGSSMAYATQIANYYSCFTEKKDDKEFKEWFESTFAEENKYDFEKEHNNMQTSMGLVVHEGIKQTAPHIVLPKGNELGAITDIMLNTAENSNHMALVTIDAISKNIDNSLPSKPSRSTTQSEYKTYIEAKLLKLDDIIELLDNNERIEELVDKHIRETAAATKTVNNAAEITVLGSLYSIFEKNRQGVMQMVTGSMFSTNPVQIAAYHMKTGLIRHKLALDKVLHGLAGGEIEVTAQIQLLITQSETIFNTFTALFRQFMLLITSGSALVLMYKMRGMRVLTVDGKLSGLDLRSTGGSKPHGEYLEITDANLLER